MLTTGRYHGTTLLYTRFAMHFDADSAAVAKLQRKKDTLFMYVEFVGSVFLFFVVLGVAVLRDYDMSNDEASFVILNACFSNAITHLFVTATLDMDEIGKQRRHVAGAAPVSGSASHGDGDGGSDGGGGEPGARGKGMQGDRAGWFRIAAGSLGCGIVFEGVDLGYGEGAGEDGGGPVVIHGLDLDIKPGQRLGVVGRTGAGKSTLIRAISGLLAPMRGALKLDGLPLGAVPEDKLRSLVAVINQTPHLFAGSIRFNLDPLQQHEDEAIFQALRRVHALAFIRRQTSGLDTVVSAGGASLSAGERQLICLARALLRGARVILLDEATASLDDELLGHIETALAECSKTATVIQIAHQTATVMPCDRVIVLHAGVIVEDGNPRELCAGGSGHFFGMAQQDSRRATAMQSFMARGGDDERAGAQPGSRPRVTTQTALAVHADGATLPQAASAVTDV